MRRHAHDQRVGARLSARVIDGRALARRMRGALRDEVAQFTEESGEQPCLVAIGSAAARGADAWLTLKLDAARNAGMRLDPAVLPADATTGDALAEVRRAARDAAVHGVFVQYPLPGIDARAVFDAIPVDKDIDGAGAQSLHRLRAGESAFPAASAVAIMALLEEAGVAFAGARVFVGRGGAAIADPLVLLLERAGSVVERLPRGGDTASLRAALEPAEVAVFPAGLPTDLEAAWLPDGAVVVDAGYFGTRRTGDAVLAQAAPRLAAYVPARGTVGPVTVEVLLRHTLEAARAAQRDEGHP